MTRILTCIKECEVFGLLEFRLRHPVLVLTAMLQMLVIAQVLSRLEYSNGLLVGIPAYVLHQLQSVLNVAALLV